MGRQDALPSDRSRWVFNRVAREHAARPPYPPALVDRLLALAGPGGRVVDLGAGTGHLALPLARAGARMHAVEPAIEMLRVLESAAAGLALVPVHAAAEETGLEPGSADLVLVADVVQWVDPERAGREARRLLAPGGALAVVDAVFARTPFMDGLAALLAAKNPKARPLPHAGRARQLFAEAVRAPPALEAFRQEALLDDDALDPVLRSLSYAGPALGPAAFEDLVAGARELAVEHRGAVFARDVILGWARAA